MENLLTIILSSTVIVALISYIQWAETKRLERITDKRAEWRDKLRKLAIDILNSDESNELALLSTLKVNINTKGLMLRYEKINSQEDKIIYFQHDGYIWEIINKIEQSESKKQKLFLKKKLVEAISLLIKYDWDRSKNEITSSKVKKANRQTCFLLMLLGVYLFFYILQQGEELLKGLELYWLNFIILPILIPFISLLINILYEKYIATKNKKENCISKLIDNVVNIKNTSNMLLGLIILMVFITFSFCNQGMFFISASIISCLIFVSNSISIQNFQDTGISQYFVVAKEIISSINDNNESKTSNYDTDNINNKINE
ncbi:MAG: hypothetical protein ACLUVC_06560 [Longibaculum sp.]